MRAVRPVARGAADIHHRQVVAPVGRDALGRGLRPEHRLQFHGIVVDARAFDVVELGVGEELQHVAMEPLPLPACPHSHHCSD